ncbi:MAG: hypothetical protein ACI9QL_002775 [Candidatus Omnitrophota bacterium]|jgi:hypothetical protein
MMGVLKAPDLVRKNQPDLALHMHGIGLHDL